MDSQQLQEKLMSVFRSIEEATDTDKIALANEAMEVIQELLTINPFDIDAWIWRMKLHAGVGNNSAILQDAEFISSEHKFGPNKMVGYEWLAWVYEDKMALPEKAIEVINNQIVEAYSMFSERHVRDEYEGELLNKIAFIKHNNNQTDEALELWKKSFDKYPYNQHRNAVAGMLLLEAKEYDFASEMLLVHYRYSFGQDDAFVLEYTQKLYALEEEGVLSHPLLIGILYHAIRDEADSFGLHNTLDYFQKFLPKLEAYSEEFPNSSIIWSAIGATYFEDVKDYKKALKAFTKMLEGDRPTLFNYIKKIHKSAKKTKTDFFELPFVFEGKGGSLYNHLTDVSDYADNTEKKKKKRKYLALAKNYGERCYQQYHDYLINGKGSTYNNQPHIFAMLCNNFGNVLSELSSLVGEEVDLEMAGRGAKMHLVGYGISPFVENIENAGSDFFKAKMYQPCIDSYETYLRAYSGQITYFDVQNALWFIISSYFEMKDYVNLEKTYNRAKDVFEEAGPGVIDAAREYIFVGKKHYVNLMEYTYEYEKAIPVLEWFLAQDVFLKLAPDEVGLANFYMATCYIKTGQKEKSIAFLQRCVELLKDEDNEYYYDKSVEAADRLKEMGEETGHPDVKKSKGFFSLFKKK